MENLYTGDVSYSPHSYCHNSQDSVCQIIIHIYIFLCRYVCKPLKFPLHPVLTCPQIGNQQFETSSDLFSKIWILYRSHLPSLAIYLRISVCQIEHSAYTCPPKSTLLSVPSMTCNSVRQSQTQMGICWAENGLRRALRRYTQGCQLMSSST